MGFKLTIGELLFIIGGTIPIYIAACGDEEITKGPKLEDIVLTQPVPSGGPDEIQGPESSGPNEERGEDSEGSETTHEQDNIKPTVGEQGPTGPAGQQGERGEDGKTGDPGSSCSVATDESGLVYISCDDGTIEHLPTPEPGPTPTKCWETRRFKYCKYKVGGDDD